jgi:uncharacterized membrane protein/uncharacterized RDD family membrane protein YckC
LVDSLQLASDILSVALYFALPALLWMFLFLWAWESPGTARAAGFGRATFWLLLPGCLAASLGNAPIFGWEGSILAVNLGGALIPIGLSLYLPARWFGRGRLRVLLRLLATLAALTAALFALVLWPTLPSVGGFAGAYAWSIPIGPHFALLSAPTPLLAPVLVAGAILAGAVALGSSLPERPSDGPDRATGLAGLATMALLVTYATTEASPGVGILSIFPYYLIAPFLVGVLAVLLARPLFDLPPLAGIPLGYSASTLGVLLGADVLHEPPLYGQSSALLSIGGAGVLDLVYLTGLIAVVGGFLAYLGTRRGLGGLPEPAPPQPLGPPTASGAYRDGARRYAAGDPSGALSAATRAADLGVARARALRGAVPVPEGQDPWKGLGTPTWTGIDHQNLRALARSEDRSAPTAARGLFTARLLLQAAHQVGAEALATFGERAAAFFIDLVVLTAPAVFLWGLLALSLPGGADAILNGVPFNAALFGYAAYGFLYFFALEALTGTTVGKRILRLEVRTRELGRPRFLALFNRNAPRLIPLFIIAELVGPAMVLLLLPSGSVPPSFANVSNGFVLIALAAAGLLLVGGVSAVVMNLSPERARLGDLWGGTGVFRRSVPTRPEEFPSGGSPGPSGSTGS